MSTGKKDSHTLSELERQVVDGLRKADASYLQVGEVLKLIWDDKLWPQDTKWAEYVLSTFDIKEERAKQLIQFVEIRNDITGDRRPTRERQTRALKQAAPEDRQIVWDRACKRPDTNEPTGKLIEEIVRKLEAERQPSAAPTAPKPAKDKTGVNNKPSHASEVKPNFASWMNPRRKCRSLRRTTLRKRNPKLANLC